MQHILPKHIPHQFNYSESPILNSMNRTPKWFMEMLFQRGIIPKHSSTEEVLSRCEVRGSVFEGDADHTRHSVQTEDGIVFIDSIGYGIGEWAYYAYLGLTERIFITPENCPSLWAKLAPSKEVIDYIDDNARKTEAWVAEDPKNRWAAYAVSEPWYILMLIEEGIQTLDQYLHNQLLNNVFEYWRSVRGYKPDYSKLKAMSMEQLKDIDAELENESRLQREWEKQQEEVAKQKRDQAWLEARSLAQRLGQSVKTLIKWGVLDRRELYPA